MNCALGGKAWAETNWYVELPSNKPGKTRSNGELLGVMSGKEPDISQKQNRLATRVRLTLRGEAFVFCASCLNSGTICDIRQL